MRCIVLGLVFCGLLGCATVPTHLPPTGHTRLAHCACLDEVNRLYDPVFAFDHLYLHTLPAEASLMQWIYVENLYARCMRGRNAVPVKNVFPYGLSDYADGVECHPPECHVK